MSTNDKKPAWTVKPTSKGDYDSCVWQEWSDAADDAYLVLDDCVEGTVVTITYTPMTQEEFDALVEDE